MQGHLPESGSEVDGGKDAVAGSSYVPNAFRDILHGVSVNVCLTIESPKILDDAQSLPRFLRDAEDWRKRDRVRRTIPNLSKLSSVASINV